MFARAFLARCIVLTARFCPPYIFPCVVSARIGRPCQMSVVASGRKACSWCLSTSVSAPHGLLWNKGTHRLCGTTSMQVDGWVAREYVLCECLCYPNLLAVGPPGLVGIMANKSKEQHNSGPSTPLRSSLGRSEQCSLISVNIAASVGHCRSANPANVNYLIIRAISLTIKKVAVLHIGG